MLYTSMTMRAMQVAYDAHHGQTDKSGMPYILHPVHLAEQMPDELTCCAALLHDVAEDTDIGLDTLAQMFPAQVIDVLRLLTHDPSEPYMAYIEDRRRRVRDGGEAGGSYAQHGYDAPYGSASSGVGSSACTVS